MMDSIYSVTINGNTRQIQANDQDHANRIGRRLADLETDTTPEEFSETQLRSAFDAVRDSRDWKKPIAQVIDPTVWPVQLVRAAVEFYTATTISIEPIQNSQRVFVTAPGYRNGPAW